MLASQTKKTITADKKYQETRWVMLNKEKALTKSMEKRKILNTFIARKARKENRREKILFLREIGVVKFNIRRRIS